MPVAKREENNHAHRIVLATTFPPQDGHGDKPWRNDRNPSEENGTKKKHTMTTRSSFLAPPEKQKRMATAIPFLCLLLTE